MKEFKQLFDVVRCAVGTCLIAVIAKACFPKTVKEDKDRSN
jgi:hypothetical protein